MKDIKTNIGVSVKYGKVNIVKKQSTKEMFKQMTEFFFKNLCNCKK